MIPVSPSFTAAILSHDLYQNLLKPWCIIQIHPNAQRSIIARFRKRNDAAAHLQALNRLSRSTYEIVFIPRTISS